MMKRIDSIKRISKEIAKEKMAVSDPPFKVSVNTSGMDSDKSYDLVLKKIEDEIDACKSVKKIIEIINPSYKYFWLSECKPYLTNREASKMMGELGVRKISWLETADKESLMTRGEYSIYDSLPNEVTLYGYGEFWCDDYLRAMSKAKAEKKKYIYEEKVPKEKILCYYNRNEEDCFVIIPSKTTPLDINQPPIINRDLTDEQLESIEELANTYCNPEVIELHSITNWIGLPFTPEEQKNEESFGQYIESMKKKYDIKSDAEIYKKAGLSRATWSNYMIRSEESLGKSPKRQFRPEKRGIVAIAIAMKLNLDETEELLKRANLAFNPSSNWDLFLMSCIEHEIYDLEKINYVLEKNGQEPYFEFYYKLEDMK